MIDLRKLLGRKATGSADLASSIAEAQAESHAATVTVARLTQERASLLLTAEDEVLAAHDAGILAAQRQRDRADAVAAELEKRRAEMAELEGEAGRRARYEAAKSEVAAKAKWLREAYPKHATEIAKGLKQVDEVEALIVQVNADLPAGAEAFLPLEYSIRRSAAGGALPLAQTVVLPALESHAVDIWPEPIRGA